MAKQVTHKLGLMKLLSGHNTRTVSKALQELCRVKFPDCRPISWSEDGQEQLNLGASSCKMNKEDWNQARMLIVNPK
jgi:hypothetical protein